MRESEMKLIFILCESEHKTQTSSSEKLTPGNTEQQKFLVYFLLLIEVPLQLFDV